MLAGVVADLAALEAQVDLILGSDDKVALHDRAVVHRVATGAERDETFDQLASTADYTVVIAPEFEGILLALSHRVAGQGGMLLSPLPEFVAIASDKQSTAERLYGAKIPVPKGAVLMPGERCPSGFRYPAVVKPIDGCGSLGVQLVHEGDQLPLGDGAYRLEEFAAGKPASVLCICGPEQVVPLEPCLQRLAGGGDFSYQGGALPLDEPLRERAANLALAALNAMPPARGLVGVDIVLGEADDGSADYLIEVNPRCTTSYVGLRAAYDENLAQLLLAVSNGEQVTPPEISRRVEWDATGEVRILN